MKRNEAASMSLSVQSTSGENQKSSHSNVRAPGFLDQDLAGHSTQAQTDVPTPFPSVEIMQIPTSGSTAAGLIQAPTANATTSLTSTTTDYTQAPSVDDTAPLVLDQDLAGHSTQSQTDVPTPFPSVEIMQIPTSGSTAAGLIQAPTTNATTSLTSTTADYTQAPSDDTGRFIHIACLLVIVGSKVLRRLLHFHTVKPACTLDQYLAAKRIDIDKLRMSRRLNKYQMEILFPPGGITNLGDYDITLVCALCLNIVPTISQQRRNMLQFLRDKRNEIVNSASVNLNDYHTFWNDTRRVLEDLSKTFGDPDFDKEISRMIQRIQMPTVQRTSSVDTQQTHLRRMESHAHESNEDLVGYQMSLPVKSHRIKNIVYLPNSVLGRGCYGTIVYKGKFDKRDVAVKRLQKENFHIADREMTLLRLADEHPNVIRYYWNEEDEHFLYIALELCQGTLQDYVEGTLGNIKLKPIELLHQTMMGLAYLHSLLIVHRDVKPHNILISRPGAEGEVRAKISDFGLSRQLPDGKTSFSPTSNSSGTEGWAAPEMFLKVQHNTLAVDIFSAGCVMYYVLTMGTHPFGDTPNERQYQINRGTVQLNQLPKTSDGYIAEDIIKDMLSSNPEARPTAEAVLQHLLFWNKDDKLWFILATSDRIRNDMVQGIENPQNNIFYPDWTTQLSEDLNDVLQREKRYQTSTVRDLLRFIRNKRHHYDELPENARRSLGSIPDEYLDFFTSRFPLLLVHIYRVMKCCSEEDAFKAYYKHWTYLD